MKTMTRAGRTRIAYIGGPLDGTTRVKTERARTSLYRDVDGSVMVPAAGDRIVRGRSTLPGCYVLTDDVTTGGVRTFTYMFRRP